MHPDDAGDDDEPLRAGASPEDAEHDPDDVPPPSLHIVHQDEIDEELDEEEVDEAPRTVLITARTATSAASSARPGRASMTSS